MDFKEFGIGLNLNNTKKYAYRQWIKCKSRKLSTILTIRKTECMVDPNVLKSIELEKKLLKFKSNEEKSINVILKLKPLVLLNISFFCNKYTLHGNRKILP